MHRLMMERVSDKPSSTRAMHVMALFFVMEIILMLMVAFQSATFTGQSNILNSFPAVDLVVLGTFLFSLAALTATLVSLLGVLQQKKWGAKLSVVSLCVSIVFVITIPIVCLLLWYLRKEWDLYK